ncbi:hypothetical protein FOL47_000845, partial [Perkinsus chesapeaki]
MKIRFGLIQKLAAGEKVNQTGKGVKKGNGKNKQQKRKVDVMPFNKKLAKAAERKELGTALGIMSSIKKAGGRPDKHTYANMINTCVRCDNIAKAEGFLAEMRETVGVSVVPMTTMLKGYASEGYRDKAIQLLDEMIDKRIANDRSISAFLRGCLRHGWCEAAITAYDKADSKGLIEDGSRNVYARILSLAGRSSEAITLKGLSGSTLASVSTTMAVTDGKNMDKVNGAIKQAERKLNDEEKNMKSDGQKNKFGDHLIAEARRDLNAAKKFLASDTSINVRPSFARFLYLPKSTENMSKEARIVEGWNAIGVDQVVDDVHKFTLDTLSKALENGKVKVADKSRG